MYYPIRYALTTKKWYRPHKHKCFALTNIRVVRNYMYTPDCASTQAQTFIVPSRINKSHSSGVRDMRVTPRVSTLAPPLPKAPKAKARIPVEPHPMVLRDRTRLRPPIRYR